MLVITVFSHLNKKKKKTSAIGVLGDLAQIETNLASLGYILRDIFDYKHT